MATKHDLLLTIERFLDSTRNWNLSRRYTASLADRTEGFTEKFGDPRLVDDINTESSLTTKKCWKQEQESVEFICATDHPPQSIRLIQYRPAWLEQLALRIAGIPHVVTNSRYAVMEAVGPLPCLQDLANHPPAMVGRRMAHTSTSKTDNAILDYLKQSHNGGFHLDQHLPPEQHHQAFSYQTLIHQTMEPCLTVLQFADDEFVWSQITRQRCIRAGTCSGTASGRESFSFLAFLQARSERVHELGRLSAEYRTLSTEEAIQRIRACYEVFESILEKQSSSLSLADNRSNNNNNNNTTPSYLCGTSTPCLVDVLLWDHLMHALTDIHLVVVLADFPALIAFVTNIWEEYFAARKNASPSLHPSNDWKVWNAQQNESNAFCNIPSLVTTTTTTKSKNSEKFDKVIHFQHAIDLMEHLSVKDRNLLESLQVAKEARSLQDDAAQRKGGVVAPFQTWHRWRMGGTLYPLKDNDDKSSNAKDSASEQERKLRKEYQRNDEMWVATVATATTIAFLIFGLVATPKQE